MWLPGIPPHLPQPERTAALCQDAAESKREVKVTAGLCDHDGVGGSGGDEDDVAGEHCHVNDDSLTSPRFLVDTRLPELNPRNMLRRWQLQQE